MRPGAPSVAEASRSLSSVKTGEPPTDDDIVTSVAYEPNDDAEPVSPELALVDPSLAARLRADLREAPPEPEPEPERAVAAPAEPVGASAPIPDQAPVEAPEPPVVVPVHHAPVALVQPLPGHGDPEDATTSDEPELPSASVHVLRAAPAAEKPVVVVEPLIVYEPDPQPEPAREPEPEPRPEPGVRLPMVTPPSGPRGRSAVSPLRRRSRFWHVLVLLATAMLFAGVVAVGVVVVSGLTDRDSGSNVTASGDPPVAAAPAPESGEEQDPGAAPAPTENSPEAPAPTESSPEAPAPTENSQGAPAPRRFAWAPVAGALSYRFELFRGDEQVLRATTRNPVYELPASWRHQGREERLTAGSYRWYVWPVLASGPADAAVVQARLDVP